MDNEEFNKIINNEVWSKFDLSPNIINFMTEFGVAIDNEIHDHVDRIHKALETTYELMKLLGEMYRHLDERIKELERLIAYWKNDK